MRKISTKFNIVAVVMIFAVIFINTGCTKRIRYPLPEEYADSANPVGIEQVRDWGDTYSEYFQNDFIESAKQGRKNYPEIYQGPNPTVDILAISGGGAYGAWGIGLLKGWSDSGNMHIFGLVTGISTGALIAPFAFLGGEYLDVIANFYTNITDRDIFIKKPLSSIIGSDSVATSLPLQRLIEENIDQEFLQKVAEEHKKGRRLLIGTTNLDAKRLVIWNMGHIAEIGDAKALELFQKVILASASVPVALNPIYISVEADGKVYDEMHVDGGATVQVFFYGSILDIESAIETLGIEDKPKIRLFIIRNAIFKPDYEPVRPRLSSIAASSLSNLIRNEGIGDLYRIYTISQRDGFEFNLASLPADYEYEKDVAFDPNEMKLLFNLGYEAAINGYPWEKYPPLYDK
ncbi:MAG: hypothetical protein GTO02_05540 [Candidatus Dadabacteria bacterium]|nr:hypothetical protein [Candidatus Dadabacteria bacterium]NIQ13869.1 hypothetical protein [Candidatus Dadabacteria bacterium]